MHRLAILMAVGVSALAVLAPTSTTASPAADHQIELSGASVTTYPPFDPGVDRYGIRTGPATGGSVTVTATTSDQHGTITLNGQRVGNGVAATVDGLTAGDEVSVVISDVVGIAVHSYIYLPPGFPILETTGNGSDGFVFLDLIRFSDDPGFETIIDGRGVPIYVNATNLRTWDFKRQPDGRYSVVRQTSTSGQSDYEVVVLDEQFEESASYETVGLQNTDNHDSILAQDGSRTLLAYEQDFVPGWRWHSDIEETDSAGTVRFHWSSEGHIPEADNLTPNTVDYAHINSIDRMADGDYLASFRNTSQVLKIARVAHDGHQPGEVIWRLGGVSSDFDFVNDPHGGPCAQHHAQELDNGHILLFDNGSEANPQFLPNAADMCPDPTDPDGPRVARTFSRVTEYALDVEAMTATLVWSYEHDQEVFGVFTGSVQRLANGNTLVGWGTASPVATEVDSAGAPVWEVTASAPDGNDDYWSYRAFRFPVPDAIVPEVDLGIPGDARVGQGDIVDPVVRCSDRGGSNLVSCTSTPERVDTSTPGVHELTASATDGAGNRGTAVAAYTVESRQPDARIRLGTREPLRGDDIYGADGVRQSRTASVRRGRRAVFWVSAQNDGAHPQALVVSGLRSARFVSLAASSQGVDVTAAMSGAGFRTTVLAPGEEQVIRIVATVGRRAPRGTSVQRLIEIGAAEHPVILDVVRLAVSRS